MFPVDVQTYLENEDLIIEELNMATFNGQSFLFDFKKGDFVYVNGSPVEVHGRDALEIWIEKVIRTERSRYKIYENIDYGISVEDLIGSIWPRGFIEAEMKRELTEAILLNPLIEELTDWNFVKEGSLLTVQFSVITIDGAFEMEVAI